MSQSNVHVPTTDKHQEAFNKLNAKQQEAVLQIDGPVLVLAGPGTGKTEVLAVRIGQILKQQDVYPSNILCLTYSTAAVDAMRSRLRTLIGSSADEIAINTYHSLCNRLILQNAEDTFRGRTLMTDAQRHMLIEKLIYDHLSPSDKNFLKPASSSRINDLSKIFQTLKQENITKEDLVRHAENCINNILPLEEKYIKKNGELNQKGKELKVRIEKFATDIANMYEDYNRQLDERNKYEFEDMLIEGVLLLQSNQLLATRLQEQYQYILVDEFQDTNLKQLALINQLCSNVMEPNIFAVGDDDQCIYRFQGASQQNFEWMRRKFPNLKTILLDINYRSTAVILQESFGLISSNSGRQPEKDKPLKAGNSNYHGTTHKPSFKIYEDAEQEAYDIARQIHESSDGKYNGIAILARKHSELNFLTQWLDHYKVPYQSNRTSLNLLGTPFGKCFHYLLQFIRCHELNSRLAEGFLVQYLLQKRIGNDLLRAFLLSKQIKGVSFFDWLISDANPIASLSSIAKEINQVFIHRNNDEISAQINSCIALAQQGLADAVTEQQMAALNEFIQTDRDKNLLSIANMLWYQEQNGIPIWFELVVQEDGEQNAVTLSTIHGSKGLQYDTVFLIGCHNTNWEQRSGAEGIKVPDLLNRYIIPEPDSEDDMRRLLYVACTRAKTRLQASAFRNNFNGKPLTVTTLLEGFKNSDQVDYKEVPEFELPFIESNDYTISCDEGLMNLIQERLASFEISPTSTASWERCQNEFFFNAVMKLPGTSAEAASFGNLFHGVLQAVTSDITRQHDPAFVHGLVEEEMDKLKLNFHPTRIGRYKQYGMWLISEYLRSHPFVKKPDHIEDEFHHVLSNGAKIKGKLDRVDVYDDHVNVVDYKTGKYKKTLKEFESAEEPGTQYWRQANMYTLLMQENFGSKGKCNFEFHYPENNKTIDLYAYENHPAFLSWLETIWTKTQSFSFASNCANQDCIYCKNKLI